VAVWQYRASPNDRLGDGDGIMTGLNAMLTLAGATSTLGAWYMYRGRAKDAADAERQALDQARDILPDRLPARHDDRNKEEQ
jgi:hypothetical protein